MNKRIYEHDENGIFKQSHELAGGVEYEADKLPNCVQVAPPELSEGLQARWNGADWTIENVRTPISY